MTPINELFSGVGIVIDEQVFSQENKNINKIVSSLEHANIPLVKYDKMPDDDVLTHLKQISFVLLDWNLSGERLIPPATIEDNINFIKIMRQQCFAPLFVFSDERLEDIEAKLEEENLYRHGQSNAIFIKHKEDVLTIDDLWREIEAWMRQTPSMYVAKEWECARTRALVEMLHDFDQASPYWPSVLQETIEHDGTDTGEELSQLLNKNLESRMQHVGFDTDIVKLAIQNPTKQEIRNVLETKCFIHKELLPDYPMTGDVYFKQEENMYYINIRPDCDIIREQKDLYLLKGQIINEDLLNKLDEELLSKFDKKLLTKKDLENPSIFADDAIIFQQNNFIEKVNQCVIPFIDGHVIDIKFRKLSIGKWQDLKPLRVGRILSPYITRLQQKYAFYLQRQGVPAIPKQAFFEKQ